MLEALPLRILDDTMTQWRGHNGADTMARTTRRPSQVQQYQTSRRARSAVRHILPSEEHQRAISAIDLPCVMFVDQGERPGGWFRVRSARHLNLRGCRVAIVA